MDPLTLATLLSAAGTVAGGIGSFFGGNKGIQSQQMPTVPDWQEQLFRQGGQAGLSGLQGLLGQPSMLQGLDFGGIENQARKGWQESTIPSLAERFSSMGTGGSQGSSAFTQSLGQSGAGLESDLAGLRSSYGLQRAGLGLQEQGQRGNILSQLLQMGMQPTMQTIPYQQPSGWQTLGQTSGQMFGSLAPLLALRGMGGQQQPQGGLGWLGGTSSNPYCWR